MEVLGYGLGLFQKLTLVFTLHVCGEDDELAQNQENQYQGVTRTICNGQRACLRLQISPPVDWSGPVDEFIDHFYQNASNISFVYKCVTTHIDNSEEDKADSSNCANGRSIWNANTTVLMSAEAPIVFTRTRNASDTDTDIDTGGNEETSHVHSNRVGPLNGMSGKPLAVESDSGLCIHLYTTINVAENHIDVPLQLICGLKYTVEAASFGANMNSGTGSGTGVRRAHEMSSLRSSASYENNSFDASNSRASAMHSEEIEESALRLLLENNRFRPTRIPSREVGMPVRIIQALHLHHRCVEIGPSTSMLLLTASNRHPRHALLVHAVNLHFSDSYARRAVSKSTPSTEVTDQPLNIAALFRFQRSDVNSTIVSTDSTQVDSAAVSKVDSNGDEILVPPGGTYTFAFTVTPQSNPEQSENSSLNLQTTADLATNRAKSSVTNIGDKSVVPPHLPSADGLWHPLFLGSYCTPLSVTWMLCGNGSTGSLDDANALHSQKLNCDWSIGCTRAVHTDGQTFPKNQLTSRMTRATTPTVLGRVELPNSSLHSSDTRWKSRQMNTVSESMRTVRPVVDTPETSPKRLDAFTAAHEAMRQYYGIASGTNEHISSSTIMSDSNRPAESAARHSNATSQATAVPDVISGSKALSADTTGKSPNPDNGGVRASNGPSHSLYNSIGSDRNVRSPLGFVPSNVATLQDSQLSPPAQATTGSRAAVSHRNDISPYRSIMSPSGVDFRMQKEAILHASQKGASRSSPARSMRLPGEVEGYRMASFAVRIDGPPYGLLHTSVRLIVHITNLSGESFTGLQLRSSYEPANHDAAAGATGSVLLGNQIHSNVHSVSVGSAQPSCLISECRSQLDGVLLPGSTTVLDMHVLPLQLGHLVLGALHLWDPRSEPARTYPLLQKYSLLILEKHPNSTE